jgi:hypothetical protein
MAENRGFLVTVEKRVFGGTGRIDVALENDATRIACEISVTNEPSYELQNIQKCLAAGYERVVLISTDERHLSRIRKTVQENIDADDLPKAEFLTPEEFHNWLERVPIGPQNEEKVKGYKVKTKMKAVDEGERSTRKKAISEIVFGALKRLRNKSDDN